MNFDGCGVTSDWIMDYEGGEVAPETYCAPLIWHPGRCGNFGITLLMLNFDSVSAMTKLTKRANQKYRD